MAIPLLFVDNRKDVVEKAVGYAALLRRVSGYAKYDLIGCTSEADISRALTELESSGTASRDAGGVAFVYTGSFGDITQPESRQVLGRSIQALRSTGFRVTLCSDGITEAAFQLSRSLETGLCQSDHLSHGMGSNGLGMPEIFQRADSMLQSREIHPDNHMLSKETI